MVSLARKYTPSTIKRLFLLSGNICAAPDCTNQLIAKDKSTLISTICHIEAASPEGPRYNILMTDEDRRHFDNLFLLCDSCHKIIDNKANEDKYHTSLLKDWKNNHESKLLNQLSSNSSMLRGVVDAIAKASFEEPDEIKDTSNPFKIDDKISHNHIKRNKSLIEYYKVYYSKINSLYAELEKQGSFKKESLLANIKHIYLKVKGKYVEDSIEPLTILRANADDIIDDVLDELTVIAEKDGKPDLEIAIYVVMVDAFMKCKILEEPPKV